MIKTFQNKPLRQLWLSGKTAGIDKRLHARIIVRLDALHAAPSVASLDLPGFDFHALRGFVPVRYTIHVNGPWTITFEFENGHAYKVDFEQYH